MMKRIKKYWLENSRSGQNMIEYLLVFVGIVTVMLVALGPGGIMTNRIDESLNLAVTSSRCMAVNICYDPDGCEEVCGNGCCEDNENPRECPLDCECATDADCDDGLFCNGAEVCGDLGRCITGVPPEVDDGIGCTEDACVEGVGVVNTPNDAFCDDGIACNGMETCNTGTGCQSSGAVCSGCAAPEGGTIPHEASRTYYQNATPICGNTCVSEVRVCDNGNLSGSFTNPNCNVQPCGCIGPDGTPIANGASRTYYQDSTVTCGNVCVSESRTCNGTVLSGSFTSPNCTAQSCGCIGPDGTPIANGASKTYYPATVPCGVACASVAESRQCNAGVLSGSNTAPGCSFRECPVIGSCTLETFRLFPNYWEWRCVSDSGDGFCYSNASGLPTHRCACRTGTVEGPQPPVFAENGAQTATWKCLGT